jgi:hypothetical protein
LDNRARQLGTLGYKVTSNPPPDHLLHPHPAAPRSAGALACPLTVLFPDWEGLSSVALNAGMEMHVVPAILMEQGTPFSALELESGLVGNPTRERIIHGMGEF